MELGTSSRHLTPSKRQQGQGYRCCHAVGLCRGAELCADSKGTSRDTNSWIGSWVLSRYELAKSRQQSARRSGTCQSQEVLLEDRKVNVVGSHQTVDGLPANQLGSCKGHAWQCRGADYDPIVDDCGRYQSFDQVSNDPIAAFFLYYLSVDRLSNDQIVYQTIRSFDQVSNDPIVSRLINDLIVW